MPWTTVEPTPLGSLMLCHTELGPFGSLKVNPWSTPEPSRYEPTISLCVLTPKAWVSLPPGNWKAVSCPPLNNQLEVTPLLKVENPTMFPLLLIPVAALLMPGTLIAVKTPVDWLTL